MQTAPRRACRIFTPPRLPSLSLFAAGSCPLALSRLPLCPFTLFPPPRDLAHSVAKPDGSSSSSSSSSSTAHHRRAGSSRCPAAPCPCASFVVGIYRFGGPQKRSNPKTPSLHPLSGPRPSSATAGHYCPVEPLFASSDLLNLFVILLAGLSLGFTVINATRPQQADTRLAEGEDGADARPIAGDNMATDLPPGRPGNLTAEQEEKLRQLWQRVFTICGVDAGANDTATTTDGASDNTSPITPSTPKTADPAALPDAKKPWKKRLAVFSRSSKGSKKDGDSTPDALAPVNASLAIPTPNSGPGSGATSPVGSTQEDDKYGQTKQFLESLASQTPESIRATIWSMVKHDHPDALLLRFLRARKWDVDKALVMLVSSMHWRRLEMKVDDDIMLNGEGFAVEQEQGGAGADAAARKLASDFLAQMRMGKSFAHGCDRIGRPICITRVRLHKAGEQAEESLERYTVFLIETCRLMLKPPVDTATIVFDMTDFSLANMDNSPVKFMVKCFEANFPECLGAVLIHKAPWIFQGIWKIIRGWLDPVVSSKVHFTNNANDLAEFIEPKHILKDLEGEEDWQYKFVEPVPGENDQMKDTATRDRLQAARELQVKRFEQLTGQWLAARSAAGETVKDIKDEREEVAGQLRTGYWELDPYLRARSLYDRTGILRPGGEVDFYPSAEKQTGQVKGAKNEAPSTATAAAAPTDVAAAAAATATPAAATEPPAKPTTNGGGGQTNFSKKVAALDVNGTASPPKAGVVADASADDVD